MYILHLNRIFPVNYSSTEDIHYSQSIDDVRDGCTQHEVAHFAIDRDWHAFEEQQHDHSKMRQLSMPAQGHAIENVAEAWVAGFVAVKSGIFPCALVCI
jgi:hypothetical protein